MTLALPAGRQLGAATADDVADFTRAIVAASFRTENTERQADRDQTILSASGVGGCRKRGALSIARATPTDIPPEEEARDAILGTWIHDHLIPLMVRLARQLGLNAVGEQPVELAAAGLRLTGTLDFAVDDVVWDIKSVKEHKLHGVRRAGMFYPHEIQTAFYALARWQAGYPVKWIVVIYIDRSTGEVHIEVKEFTNQLALAVINRLAEIRGYARNPDLAPRDGHGPGLAFACDRCPWLRRCWGPTAKPGAVGAQRILAATPEGIEQALAIYAAAAAVTGPAEKDKKFAKAVLDSAHVPDGRYGKFVLSHDKPGETTDNDAIASHYEEIGQPLPKKKAEVGSIRVKMAPQGDTK